MIVALRILMLGWMALSQPAISSQPTIEFQADRVTAQIAEPVELRLVARAPVGWQVKLPDSLDLPDALNGFASAPLANELKVVADDMQVVTRRYVVEAYAAGLHSIESFSVQVVRPAPATAESIVTLQTEPVTIRVQSALGLLDSPTRLRPIADRLPVPWTAGQWLSLFGSIAAVVGSVVVAHRWLNARVKRPLSGLRGLRQSLNQVDRQRLRGQLSHERAILKSADLLRQSLQLASGHPTRYLTTSEWVTHCLARHDNLTTSATRRVLTLADAIKFSGLPGTLDDVRESLTATRQVILKLEHSTRSEAVRQGGA